MLKDVRELTESVRQRRLPILGAIGANLQILATLTTILVAVLFLIWQGAGFAVTISTVFAIWAILAISLNLVLGFTGLLSVGHIGFYGIGAYTVAVLTADPEFEQLRSETIQIFASPFFAALPVAVILVGVIAFVVGVAFSRFRDDVYVLASFGFAIIAFNVFVNWRTVTRGAFGIHDIPKPQIGGLVFDDEFHFLLLALGFLILVIALPWFIVTS